MKKFSYIILAITLVMAILISPASMLTASAADEEITPEWVLMGDVDLDGDVDTTDALKTLRVAAGIDPAFAKNSKAFKAADIDKDGKITILDARKILLYAVGIGVIESRSFDEVVKLLNDTANSVKESASDPGNFSPRMPFKYTSTMKILDAYADANAAMKAMLIIEGTDLDKEMEKVKNTLDTTTSGVVHREYQERAYWNSFPVEGQEWSMKLDKSAIKTLEYTEDTENNQIIITARLKDENLTSTVKAPVDVLATNHGKVFYVADMKIENIVGEKEAGNVDWLKLNFSDSYVTYVIDADTYRPIRATYYNKWAMSMKMSMRVLLVTYTMTTTTVTGVTQTYEFDDSLSVWG